MNKNSIIVSIVCASRKEAEKIAQSIVEKKLAACANIFPEIRSRYWWKGKIEKAREVFMLAKTKKELFPALAREVKRLHSYEVPEIVAVPIVKGIPEYLQWIADSTK